MKLTALTCNNSEGHNQHVGFLSIYNAVCSTNWSLLVHVMGALLSCALLNSYHD